MKNTKFSHRMLSIILCISMIMGMVPGAELKAAAAPLNMADTASVEAVADPGTAHTWETMLGVGTDGNRYAGRVWADKSVYTDGDTAVLNTKNESDSSFRVNLEDDEAFQVVYSVLGSSMTTTETKTTSGPLDVMLVLDNSSSMGSNTSRMEDLRDSANELLDKLLDEGNNIRLGIVAYSENAQLVLPFDYYTEADITVHNPRESTGGSGSTRNGTITATATKKAGGTVTGRSAGYYNNTNVQAGFDLAAKTLEGAPDKRGRKPVILLLTDGAANTAVINNVFADTLGTPRQIYYSNDTDPMIALSTLLRCAYKKATLEKRYGVKPMVYGIGVSLSGTDGSNAIINPASNFNRSNVNGNIRTAYNTYRNTWLAGNNVQMNSGTSGWNSTRYDFVFNHDNIAKGISDAALNANINYVDTYYDVDSVDLDDTFNQIYDELVSGVFNPITSNNTQSGDILGDTGHTPLIYVDYIGEHMEIKAMQAILLFGTSYNIVDNGNGTYSVVRNTATNEAATGRNPATNEDWNTVEDILITVSDDSTTFPGKTVQKLEVKIYQEILPIMLERVESDTVGDTTTATIREIPQAPMRIFYTVGLKEDVVNDDGTLDAQKLIGYSNLDVAGKTAVFYSNYYSGADSDDTATGTRGDAHVGFKPSPLNRYYYYQQNHGIFTQITDKNTNQPIEIHPDNDYGILYDSTKHEVIGMTYDAYNALNNSPTGDTTRVYTYINFWRPTAINTDAANAAEKITYLIYPEWQYLKESVAFYDSNNEKYIGEGGAEADIGVVVSESEVAAYRAAHPDADLYAVLGVGAHRTSRFHNMTMGKAANITGTAELRYDPEYLPGTSDVHHGNDAAVFLGNNGKLTVKFDVDTGIRLTKAVSEPIGNPTDTYELTVAPQVNETITPVVKDEAGDPVQFTYAGYLLTAKVKAGQTVTITGIPEGTVCQVGEVIPDGAKYILDTANTTATVTVPTVADVLTDGKAPFAQATVTNAPIKEGNIYITKEITGDHHIPDSVADDEFNITVSTNPSLAGREVKIADENHTDGYTATFDADGKLTFAIKDAKTVEIIGVPSGTEVTVTENLQVTNAETIGQDDYFTVSYASRNHSGEREDADGTVTVPENANATVVVYNEYEPVEVYVNLDVDVTKDFVTEGHNHSGSFTFKAQQYVNRPTAEKPDNWVWEDITSKTVTIGYDRGQSGTKEDTILNVLENIPFTKVGEYAYQVLEVKGSVANVTYDRTLYTFTVTVTDDNGKLVASVTDFENRTITDPDADGILKYPVTFRNTYHTAPVSIDIEKVVDNNSGDIDVHKAGFKFKAVRTEADFTTVKTGADAAEITVFSDAAGEARVTATYTTPGTYYYVINEEMPAGATLNTATGRYELNGWTYSAAKYNVTVVVSEETVTTGAEPGVLFSIKPTPGAEESIPTPGAEAPVPTPGAEDPVPTPGAENPVTVPQAETPELSGMSFKNAPILKLTETQPHDDNTTTTNLVAVVTITAADASKLTEGEGSFANPADPTNGKLVFKNTYDPDDVTIDFNSRVKKQLTGSTLAADRFTFYVTANGQSEAVRSNPSLALRTGRNDRAGNVVFENGITVTAEGTYEYDIIEAVPAGATLDAVSGKYVVNGVYYDPTVYDIVVKVENDLSTGKLVITEVYFEDAVGNTVTFNNEYKAIPTTYTISGTKVLHGRDLKAGDFTFQLKGDFDGNGTEETSVVKNAADGTFMFDTFTYTTAGTHIYTVTEIDTGAQGIVYDATEYTVTVNVTDSNGVLSAVATVTAGGAAVTDITFVNHYVEYKLGGIKNLSGRALKTGEFEFELYRLEGSAEILVETVNNNVYGDFGFSTQYYDAAGTYQYVIKEKSGSIPGITYDTTEIPVTVTVAPDATGALKATANVENTNINFNNEYIAAPANVKFAVNKTVKGTTSETFSFNLYSTDNTFAITGAPLQTTAPVASGSAAFENVTFDKTGTFFYAIAEDTSAMAENIVYDTAHHHYVVTVKDDGTGQLKATVRDMHSNETVTGTGADVSAPVAEFTNATFDEVTEKTVYSGSDTVNIDGQKVSAGTDLTYFIKYTNYTGADVTVDIMDTIPEHTEYVSGSASHNGTYAGTHVNWVLNVPEGETVEVSFTVKVVKTEVIITNTAVVRDGVNTYTTNEVKNHTIEHPAVKDVFLSQDPLTSINGDKVYETDELLYTVSYTNASNTAVDVTVTDIIPQYTTYVDGSADKGGVYDAADKKLTWTLSDVRPWATETVSFKVTVDENIGAVTMENVAQYDVNNADDWKQTNKVENYTVVDRIEKDVALSTAPAVSIDGQEVKAGDELLYTISYTNSDSADPADPAEVAEKTVKMVTITDTIPQYTTYVDGSADNSGVYSSGTITWTIENIAPGETVTVSFKVTVDDVYTTEITNEATVVEGRNINTTNTTEVGKNNDIDVTINIQKHITRTGNMGHTLGGFEFQLKNVTDPRNTVTLPNAVSDNNGQTRFILHYGNADKDKVYKYELVEINQGESNMTYDPVAFEFIVEITVDGTSGKLVAEVTQNGTAVETDNIIANFINIYNGNTEVPDDPADPGRVVDTADITNTTGYAGVMAVSAAALAVLLFIRFRKKDEEVNA